MLDVDDPSTGQASFTAESATSNESQPKIREIVILKKSEVHELGDSSRRCATGVVSEALPMWGVLGDGVLMVSCERKGETRCPVEYAVVPEKDVESRPVVLLVDVVFGECQNGKAQAACRQASLLS